jgi:predicted nucleic acid-binding protein
MTAPVFVDTNVFVYARDAGEPTKQRLAMAWLDQLWRERTGRTSVQVLSEYFVTVTRKLRPGLSADNAWEDVRALFTWRPCAIDAVLMRRAYEITDRYALSWWDGLVVSAAEQQSCALLLTEDLQDGGVYGSVTARSPFTLAVGEPAAPYRVDRAVEQGHPARGRPRRSTQSAPP